MLPILPIISRWLHIVSACLALGGLFFMCFILPYAVNNLNAEQKKEAKLRARRIFKMLVHTCILLLLVSGIYNAALNFHIYNEDKAIMHSILGLHILLALLVFGVAIMVLAGREPRKGAAALMLLNLILILLAIAAASTLKSAREKAMTNPPPFSGQQ